MTNEYLLPCSCGQANRISLRQAGETIQCVCGNRLEVPTMRGLRQLEPVVEKTGQTKAAWGPRQGLLFLGLLLAAVSLAACGYIYWAVMPSPPELVAPQAFLDRIAPVDAWRYWTLVREGMPKQPPPDIVDMLERSRRARMLIEFAAGGILLGLALAASGLLIKPRRA